MMPAGLLPPPPAPAAPAPAVAPLPAPQQKSAPIPLSEAKLAYWRKEIDKARDRRKQIAEKHGWDENLERYQPQDRRQGEDINLQADFADVESKKAALLFDTPAVSLSTEIPEIASFVVDQQKMLNTILGPQHANFKPTALKAVFNCLCPAGVGPAVVGYHCTKQPITVQLPVTDPLTGGPQLDPTGQVVMQTQTIEIPIHESFFITDLSPRSLLLPAELRDTDFQKAAMWLGWEWRKPTSQVRREHNLPPDWTAPGGGGGGAGRDKPYFTDGDEHDDSAAGDPEVSGVEIWYRTALDPQPGQVPHPDAIRRLVIVDGADQPLVHGDSPHQTFIAQGPDAGRLTPDSLIGFGLRPLVLRDVTDSPWVASDCAMTAQLTKEQQKYRTIALAKRDRNKQLILFDATHIPGMVVDAMGQTTGDLPLIDGYLLPVKSGALAGGVGAIMAEVAKFSQSRETYEDQEIIAGDRAAILGIDRNRVGVRSTGSITATESQNLQRNSDARFQQEQDRVLAWTLDIARAMDTLILRYADERLAIAILGPKRGPLWFKAKATIAGRYGYAIQIDSGKYIDVEADRHFWMQIYNATAKDPRVNGTLTLKKLAPKIGMDPNEWVVEPPPAQPDPPKVTVSISADQLLPGSPAFEIQIAILEQGGFKFDQAMIQRAQQQAKDLAESARTQEGEAVNEPVEAMTSLTAPMPMQPIPPPMPPGPPGMPGGPPPQTHGGAQPPGDVVNKHLADESGQLPGPV